jgi:hypothetical protein
MKKNSSFKLRSGNKPSIAKFIGVGFTSAASTLKDVLGKKSKKTSKFDDVINIIDRPGIRSLENFFSKK